MCRKRRGNNSKRNKSENEAGVRDFTTKRDRTRNEAERGEWYQPSVANDDIFFSHPGKNAEQGEAWMKNW